MSEDSKYILKTSLITLGIIVSVAIIVFCVCVFCVPVKTADFVFNLGMKSFASDLYYKEYDKTKDINYLNRSLNIQLEIGNNEKIIKLSEEFFNHSDYTTFINELNQNNLETNFNLYTKSKLIAEDNYYKNAYVKSLIKVNRTDDAYNFSRSTFTSTQVTLSDLGVYVFSNLLGEIDYTKFNIKLNETDAVVLYEKIDQYFSCLYNLFEEKSVNYLNSEKVYIYGLSSRILQVGNDLKTIAENITTSLNVSDIEIKLDAIADYMQNLMGE